MVSVLRFPPCADTVAVMSVLLERAVEGQLRHAEVRFWTPEGGEQTVRTGRYKVPREKTIQPYRRTGSSKP